MKKPNENSTQLEVDQIKILLRKGMERQEIWRRLSKAGNLTKRTFDRRLKEAREQLEPIEKRARKIINDRLDKEIVERAENALKGLEIINKIDTQILKEFQQAIEAKKSNGQVEMPILTVFKTYKNARLDLNEIFTRLKLEAGEPTTLSKTDNNHKIQEIKLPSQIIFEEISDDKSKN